MKNYLLAFFFLSLSASALQAQLYPKDYDAVDFTFDSLYSVNYQKHLRAKDSIALVQLYSDLNALITQGGSNNELIITNSSIHSLPMGIEKMVNLESVVFANCKNLDLEKVLDQLSVLTKIKSLEISNSAMYSLPGNIAKLTNLTHLNIKENKIVKLPKELLDLKSLRVLNVSNNKILNEDFLFDLVVKMPQIKTLMASYCNIRALPTNASTNAYDYLELKGNLLKNLPVGLKVKNLNLNSNPYLETNELFNQLASNSLLENLSIGYNKWTTIPGSIGKLKQLKSLDLRGNNLSSLPEEIGNLSQLNVLKVDNPDKYIYTNKLTSLPSSFSKLSELDSLFLSGNKITSLPSNFSNLNQLVYLDLSWNKLESFPKAILDLKKLEYLNLAINHVVNLPNEITELSELKYLNLQGDFFVNYKLKIKNIPGAIGQLTKLETLILSDNVIEVLPESIGQCKQLKVLDLKDNLFANLPSSFGSLVSLKELNLKANELTNLPNNFNQLSSLKRLDVSFNFSLASDAASVQIGKIQGLEYLNIADSYFSETAVSALMEALPTTSIITYIPKKEKQD